MPKTESKPLFTVIIPTKDRAQYLRHTLRTCSDQDYENLEVIVSDDGSSDNTKEVVLEAARKDTRIRYTTPGSSSVGMRDNFEFALDQVKPGYLIALGGDDGILPYGIRRMWQGLEETGMDILTWAAPIFTYSGVRDANGQLRLNRPSKSRVVCSSEYLARQASKLHYLGDSETPMFYIKGVVATRLIEQVRSRTKDGRFYVCPTPDGFSGIVLAGEVEKYAFSGIPLSIAGESPTGQGRAYLSGGEQGKKLSDAFYRSVSDIPMHRDLAAQPYSPLISVMTADYLLTAKDLPGWPGCIPEIEYKSLLLKALMELANGLYSADRVNRELGILHKIARHHGLEMFFKQKVKQMRRGRSRKPFAGNGITPRQVLLDCDMFEIHNIFDAAYVCYFVYQLLSKFNFAAVKRLVADSLKYKVQQLQKGDPFAPESEWIMEA
ncbi:MAG: glycosyltransferase family 2 protein [Acidobacteriaceae bacterium]